MEIILGKYAGFCRGVAHALATIEAYRGEQKLCTYGAIINNKHVTNALSEKGVHIIEDLSRINKETVVIRTHGVPPAVYEALDKRRIPYIDCTCRDVKKIHRLVRKYEDEGRRIIIVGNEDHPEIIGIRGHALNGAIILKSLETLLTTEIPADGRYALVVQTTYLQEKFEEIVSELEQRQLDIVMCNTICQSMIDRQKEAEALSKTVDIMVVIGDYSSSNTTKLYEICKQNCRKTYLIETIVDLELNILSADGKIGVVAGASTPPEIIKEAFLTMNESEQAVQNQTFEEMLDESFITLHTGDVVKGTVIQVANGEVSVNLGYKSDGLIPKNEYSEDPDVDPADFLRSGDDIEVFVVRVNDGEGNVLLSKKKVDAKRGYDEVEAAFNEKTPVLGKVVEVVKGGVIANVKGVRVFVPSSQMSNRYVEDLSQFKGKEMNFEIIEFDKTKRRIVGGRKALAIKEQEENRDKVYACIEVGQDVEGSVSRLVNFGAFIDLGGVDGLIHISELSWGRVQKVTDVLAVGDIVKARVLEVDKEKGRISLSLKNIKEDPWHSVSEKFQIGQIIDGKVVRMTSFGAFVEIAEGIDGLIHISQIAAKHVVKPEDELEIGQIIQVKIMDIDLENNRISLSKKEADGVLDAREESPEDGAVKQETETTVAEEAAPEAIEPEAVEPEAVEPEAVEPEAAEPEAVEPEAQEPEAVEPEAQEPEAQEPKAVEADA